MKVVVVGGGYAGLACLIELKKCCPGAELHLIDTRSHHVKLTRLHETLVQKLSAVRRPFTELADKFGFTFEQAAVDFSTESLSRLDDDRMLEVAGRKMPFDALVLATGARSIPLPEGENVFHQEDFIAREGRQILADFLRRTRGRAGQVTVVGGGATGIQFLFALQEALKSAGSKAQIRMVDLEPRLLSHLPEGFDRYLRKRLRRLGVEHLPGVRYLGSRDGMLTLETLADGAPLELPSDLTLLFPGVAPQPVPLEANSYGQVLADGWPLEHVFGAGDCCRFSSSGLNALTAQAALRKGRQVAGNICRRAEGRRPRAYVYREIGYFVSLGAADGIGWAGLPQNILTGLPAIAIKNVLESQYDLYLQGIDTYLR